MVKQSLKIQEFITIAKRIEDKLDKLLIQKEISNLNPNCCDKNADEQYCEEHGYPPCPCMV